MTRQSILVAILIAWSAPVAADDYWSDAQRRDEPAAAHAVVSDEVLADPPVGARTGVAGSGGQPGYDVYYTLQDDAKAAGPQDFREVCDCGCVIPSLADWCHCDQPCCTTDEWCMHPCEGSHGNCYLTPEGNWVSNDWDCDVWGDPPPAYHAALRLGGWGVATDGSQQQIGEYQDLHSSPFWDLDGISSNGDQTLDFTLSGLDNEASHARVYYYGPGMSGKVRFERFLHRVDHDPLYGFPRPTFPAVPGPNDNVVVEDLNVGEDYAIRVQQLDARFKGPITENIDWKLNLWGMRKFGERQATATAHCFNVNAPAAAGANGNVCHVLSQKQNIDWLTMEIEPGIVARYENLTVEYTRTMRSFGQTDQVVDRQYTRFNFNLPAASGFLGPDYNYALVPENFTQIDRLKANVFLTETSQIYANMYLGDTKNEFRDTHRQFNGFDVRWIDRSFERITSTWYVSNDNETNETPPFFFNAPPLSPAGYDQASIRHPVDRFRTRAGWKGNWRPSSDFTNGFSLGGGYEYYQLERDFAAYDTALGTFVQPDTKSHSIHLSPQMRWSPTWTNYVRYKVSFIEDPLIGVREANGRFNTKQPEQTHGVDIGGTWTPADNFVATAQFTVFNSWHSSEFASFNEDNYPFFLTLFYAPTDRLSFTGGYAYLSNWINQDITLGFTVPGIPAPPLRTETTNWDYRGENHLVHVSANYAWTSTVTLTAGYEWDHGTNTFIVPPSPAGADWSLLPSLADVEIETQRATMGADWQPYDNLVVFARYVYYDWNDISAGLESGTAHMALGGASILW